MSNTIILIIAAISLVTTLICNYIKLFWFYSITDIMWGVHMTTIILDGIVMGMILCDFLNKRKNKDKKEEGNGGAK